MTAVSSDQSSKTKFNFLSGVRYEHLLAGISGGVISTCILHPLDLLKIRCITFCLWDNANYRIVIEKIPANIEEIQMTNVAKMLRTITLDRSFISFSVAARPPPTI